MREAFFGDHGPLEVILGRPGARRIENAVVMVGPMSPCWLA